jgi:hypothetical protein
MNPCLTAGGRPLGSPDPRVEGHPMNSSHTARGRPLGSPDPLELEAIL